MALGGSSLAIIVLPSRPAKACPCDRRAPGDPRAAAPDDEAAPIDAHVWLWFPRLVDRRSRSPSRTFHARTDASSRRIALTRRDHELDAQTVVELVPPAPWPAETLVRVFQTVQTTAGAPVVTTQVASFWTTSTTSKYPTWSGTSDAQLVVDAPETSACGAAGQFASAVLDDPRDAETRPLLFVWSVTADAIPSSATRPTAIIRLEDEMLELQSGIGCGAANFAFLGDSIVTMAADLAGHHSTARRARVIGAAPAEAAEDDVNAVESAPSVAEPEHQAATSQARTGGGSWLVGAVGSALVAASLALARRRSA